MTWRWMSYDENDLVEYTVLRLSFLGHISSQPEHSFKSSMPFRRKSHKSSEKNYNDNNDKRCFREGKNTRAQVLVSYSFIYIFIDWFPYIYIIVILILFLMFYWSTGARRLFNIPFFIFSFRVVPVTLGCSANPPPHPLDKSFSAVLLRSRMLSSIPIVLWGTVRTYGTILHLQST